MRDRRRRARRLRRVRDAAPRRARAGRDRRLRRPSADPAAAWRARGGGDPAAADALGERRALPADVVPGPRGRATRVRRGSLAPLVRERLRPLPPDRRGVPRARRRAARAHRLGRRASAPRASSASRAVDGGFELDGARHVPPRAARARPSGPRTSRTSSRATARAVHAYEPHEYADEVAVVGAGMAAATEWLNALAAGAEVVSVRRREPRAPAAQRAAAALHAPRPRRVPRDWRRASARRSSRALLGAVVPAGPRVGRAARARRRRALPRRAPSSNGDRAGDLRDRLPARLPRTTRCSRGSSRSTGSRRTDRWIVLAPDSTVPGAHGRRRARSSLAGVAAQWAFPAADTLVGAKYAARALPPQGGGDVVHAERTARVPARRGARCRSLAACVLARALHELVAARARRR